MPREQYWQCQKPRENEEGQRDGMSLTPCSQSRLHHSTQLDLVYRVEERKELLLLKLIGSNLQINRERNSDLERGCGLPKVTQPRASYFPKPRSQLLPPHLTYWSGKPSFCWDPCERYSWNCRKYCPLDGTHPLFMAPGPSHSFHPEESWTTTAPWPGDDVIISQSGPGSYGPTDFSANPSSPLASTRRARQVSGDRDETQIPRHWRWLLTRIKVTININQLFQFPQYFCMHALIWRLTQC